MCEQKNNNIVLIGMMGVGKTAVGRLLARELGYQFLDTDLELEAVTGLKAKDVLRKYGKIRFYSEEALIIKKLADVKDMVISTGGGTLLPAESALQLKQLGTVVWLTASAQTIYDRVKRKKNRSFLPKQATVETIAEMLALREPHYAAMADVTVSVEGCDIETIVKKILAKTSSLL